MKREGEKSPYPAPCSSVKRCGSDATGTSSVIRLHVVCFTVYVIEAGGGQHITAHHIYRTVDRGALQLPYNQKKIGLLTRVAFRYRQPDVSRQPCVTVDTALHPLILYDP